MNKPFEIPILFLIFNRPDTTQKVFNEIKKIKPRYLFISADGPRDKIDGEKNKCEETRKIIEQIDWDCDVYKNFSNKNLGCKTSVSSGINWFFANVEEGIILEDDCIPDLSFFKYCEELLKYYRNDEKIFMISGDCFIPKYLKSKDSYYFSNLSHVWGWASWRRAWNYYNVEIPDLPKYIKQKEIRKIWNKSIIRSHYLNLFKEVYNKEIDTWDYQWLYTMWKNNATAINPNINLVSNIGFGETGTHTLNIKDKNFNVKAESINFPLIHPLEFEVNIEADDYENTQLYLYLELVKTILKKIKLFKIIRKIYKYIK